MSCVLGRLGIVVAVVLAVAGCVRPGTGWDGRRGYDGNGDYGYDPDAPREAAVFEARARRSYPVPGPPV